MLTRRHLLATAAGAALAAALPRESEAAAAAIIAAAAAAANAVAEMMKKSGDVEAEWQAVNLKLDRLIAGIEELQRSMVLLAHMIDDLSRVVQGIPSDVVTLQIVIEARQRLRQVGESISLVGSRPDDAKARDFFSDAVRELYKVAGYLFAATEETNRPPALVIAAIDVLHATRMLKRFQAKLGEAAAVDSQLVQTSSSRALESLRVMAGPEGVAKRLAEVRAKIDGAKALVNSIRLSSILPKGWGDPVAAVDPSTSAYCTLGAPREVDRHSRIHMVKDTAHVGFIDSWRSGSYREVTPIVRIPFSIAPVRTVSGRPVYTVEARPSQEWKQESWSRSFRFSEPGDTEVTGNDPVAILNGCAAVPLRPDGLPADIDAFMAAIAQYNALTAVESLLVALQMRAEQSIAAA